MLMVDFAEIMLSKTVCEIELLAEKMGIEKEELESQLRKKVIGNYPITIFENVVIVTSENLTTNMIAELNQLIKPNFDKLSNPKEMKGNFLELLTKNNISFDITHKDIENLMKALNEVEKI